jgi:Fe-S-cluster containining protein
VIFFDCQLCGACCCNSDHNRDRGSRDYIEVTRSDALLTKHRPLLKQVGERRSNGSWYLKLVGEEQRCVGLEGELGSDVRCTLYPQRPAGCRLVESGDDECLKARRRLGLPVLLSAEKRRLRLLRG